MPTFNVYIIGTLWKFFIYFYFPPFFSHWATITHFIIDEILIRWPFLHLTRYLQSCSDEKFSHSTVTVKYSFFLHNFSANNSFLYGDEREFFQILRQGISIRNDCPKMKFEENETAKVVVVVWVIFLSCQLVFKFFNFYVIYTFVEAPRSN